VEFKLQFPVKQVHQIRTFYGFPFWNYKPIWNKVRLASSLKPSGYRCANLAVCIK